MSVVTWDVTFENNKKINIVLWEKVSKVTIGGPEGPMCPSMVDTKCAQRMVDMSSLSLYT